VRSHLTEFSGRTLGSETSVDPVARSGDLATTRSPPLGISGSYFRPLSGFGILSATNSVGVALAPGSDGMFNAETALPRVKVSDFGLARHVIDSESIERFPLPNPRESFVSSSL
jgi:hypothetical protein